MRPRLAVTVEGDRAAISLRQFGPGPVVVGLGRVGARLVVALGIGLGLAACGDGEVGDVGDADELGEAPSYSAVTLAGDSVSLGELRGEAVLLNVWATWCAPCRVEIPELQALHEEHGDRGLRVVGVTVDSRAAEADVHQFIQEFGMTYAIWWDPDHTVLNRFGGSGVPLSVLIDQDGNIVWRHLGMFQREDPELRAALERTVGL